jgi:hypothetical protein
MLTRRWGEAVSFCAVRSLMTALEVHLLDLPSSNSNTADSTEYII